MMNHLLESAQKKRKIHNSSSLETFALECIQEAVILVEDDLVTYTNRSCETLLSIPSNMLVGTQLYFLAINHDFLKEKHVQSLKTQQTVQFLITLNDGNNKPIEVMLSVHPMDARRSCIVLSLQIEWNESFWMSCFEKNRYGYLCILLCLS